MNSRPLPRLAFAALLAAALLAPALEAREEPLSLLPTYEPWDAEVVSTFENLLVQDGGRVKPIHTVARFTLMQFSGRTLAGFQTIDGETHKLDYAEWLLDVLFRGEVAKDIPVFIVDDSAAVVQIGVSPKAKRDRYSYNELLPGRAKLAELSAEFAEKQRQHERSEKDPQYELDRIEGMVLSLGRNISTFEYLLGQFGFARGGDILVNESILPEELVELARRLDVVEMLDRMPEMSLEQLVETARRAPGDSEDERMFSGALRLFFFHANSGRGLNFFPPQDKEDEEWLSVGDALLAGLASRDLRPWVADELRQVQGLVQARNESPETFSEALVAFAERQHSVSDPRGEGVHAELEVSYYQGNYFGKSLAFFIIAFVVMAFSWLTPGSKVGRALLLVAALLAVAGLMLNIYGITLRCIIRSRPPITNLYDTVIFITAIAVILGLFIEYFTRLGIGTFVAVVSGFLGMFLSIKYEAKEASDTMGQLVAVLDTNFWLWTHVTIINIGYAAALVAAIIGIAYLAGRFALRLLKRESKRSKDFFRLLTRMNYGVVCFCLFFALVGTVLGGIWANYSWGRFWGWDPKENGALMICLWCLVILHGRMAGWIRDLGVHMNSLILAGITTFSWWGVNNLGVGLHSYGFTDGVWGALFTSWGVMAIFMAMGFFLFFSDRSDRSGKPNARAAGGDGRGNEAPPEKAVTV